MKLIFFILREGERERERERERAGGGAEREGGRENPQQAQHCLHRA